MANHNSGYDKNRAFADSKETQMRDILLNMKAANFLNLRKGTPEEDMKAGSDMVLFGGNHAIACRVRRTLRKENDLTIRSYNCGHKTELEKLISGAAGVTRYLYCWCANKSGPIVKWMLIDMEKVLESGLLEDNRRDIPNPDGITKFRAYTPDELRRIDAIMEEWAHDDV